MEYRCASLLNLSPDDYIGTGAAPVRKPLSNGRRFRSFIGRSRVFPEDAVSPSPRMGAVLRHLQSAARRGILRRNIYLQGMESESIPAFISSMIAMCHASVQDLPHFGTG